MLILESLLGRQEETEPPPGIETLVAATLGDSLSCNNTSTVKGHCGVLPLACQHWRPGHAHQCVSTNAKHFWAMQPTVQSPPTVHNHDTRQSLAEASPAHQHAHRSWPPSQKKGPQSPNRGIPRAYGSGDQRRAHSQVSWEVTY